MRAVTIPPRDIVIPCIDDLQIGPVVRVRIPGAEKTEAYEVEGGIHWGEVDARPEEVFGRSQGERDRLVRRSVEVALQETGDGELQHHIVPLGAPGIEIGAGRNDLHLVLELLQCRGEITARCVRGVNLGKNQRL